MTQSVNEEPEDTMWNKYMLQLTALKYSIYIEKNDLSSSNSVRDKWSVNLSTPKKYTSKNSVFTLAKIQSDASSLHQTLPKSNVGLCCPSTRSAVKAWRVLLTNYVEGKDTAAGISDRNDTNKVRHTWSCLKVCQQVKRKESAELLDDVIEGWTKLLGPTKVPDYSFKNIPNTKLTV